MEESLSSLLGSSEVALRESLLHEHRGSCFESTLVGILDVLDSCKSRDCAFQDSDGCTPDLLSSFLGILVSQVVSSSGGLKEHPALI